MRHATTGEPVHGRYIAGRPRGRSITRS